MNLATVQRMRTERGGVACIQFVEHRTRDSALFPEDEWGWSEDPREAWVFVMRDLPAVALLNDYERSAEFHVAALKGAGEKNRVWSCLFNVPGAQARALAQASRLASIEASAEGAVERVVIAPARPKRAVRRVRKVRQRKAAIAPEEAFARNEREGLA